MTANRGLFIRNNGNVGTTPVEGRLALAGLLFENSPGNPRSGLLDQKTPTVVTGTANMSYDVAPITPVINRAAGEGVYIFTLTGTSNVPTTAAPVVGSRYDLIYVKQNDPDKGDADNTAVVSVLQGTAATSPTKPYASLPAGAYVLAEALVQSGATATNGASVTITQVWKYTVLRGAPLPIRNLTERAEITPTSGCLITRLDEGIHALERYDGSAWFPAVVEIPFGHMGKTDGFQSISTAATLTMSAAQVLRGGMTFDNATDSLVVPATGLYTVRMRLYASGGGTGRHTSGLAKLPGSGGAAVTVGGVAIHLYKPDTSDWAGFATGTVSLSAGDKVYMTGSGPASAYGGDGYNGCWLELEYLQP